MKMDLKASVRIRGATGQLYLAILGVSAVLLVALAAPASADNIEGQVLGGGAPIAKSTVTLWQASANAPKQLAQTQTGDDGRFTLSVEGTSNPDSSILYLMAKGGEPAANKGSGNNPAIALISVIGSKPPTKVTIN
jgi:hypothetical protein